jgi:ATP-dependent DNA ligase
MSRRKGIMLAHPAEPRRIAQLGVQCFVQPKLNGERCRVVWFQGEPVLLSSEENIITSVPHINETIATHFSDWPVLPELDGELYLHGMRFEEIHSIVSRKVNKREDHYKIQLHVFDLKLPNTPQVQRFQYLMGDEGNTFDYGSVVLVPTYLIHTPDWQEHAGFFTETGYEGIILRDIWGYYEEKRSPYLLKFKPREVDEYQIVGFIEGEGWCAGKLGAFVVKAPDQDQTFNVGSGRILTAAGREHYWKHRQKYLGKTLVVKHEFLRTNTGIPKCAVAWEVQE